MKEQLIKLLEDRKVNCADPYYQTFSSKFVQKELGISKYKVLKILRELKEQGIVSYGHFGGGCQCSINESTPYCECDGGLPYWAWFYNGEHKNTYFA